MEIIKQSEEKEARRTQPGYSKESYASIAARAMNINTHESTDRRIVFELTGHKLNKDLRMGSLRVGRGSLKVMGIGIRVFLIMGEV
jgi:hypothetical protein